MSGDGFDLMISGDEAYEFFRDNTLANDRNVVLFQHECSKMNTIKSKEAGLAARLLLPIVLQRLSYQVLARPRLLNQMSSHTEHIVVSGNQSKC